MLPGHIEWVGYMASFFVAVSFIFKDVKKLRLVNMIGCLAFVVYGILIHAYPVIIANAFIFLMNLYHLIRKS